MNNFRLFLALFVAGSSFVGCGKDTPVDPFPADTTTCITTGFNVSSEIKADLSGYGTCSTTGTYSTHNGNILTLNISSKLIGVQSAYDVITLVATRGYFNGDPVQTTALLHLDINGKGVIPYRSSSVGTGTITYTSALIHASSDTTARSFEKVTITLTIQ